MQVYNEQTDIDLQEGLKKTLSQLRTKRGFDPSVYVTAKCYLLNDYLQKNHLDSCVIGISGGIDSALALALVTEAARQPYSPIKRIIPLLMPVRSSGMTNQNESLVRGLEVSEVFGLEPLEIDLTQAHHEIKQALDHALKIEGNDWACGQLVAYARTPALYYATSLLKQKGMSAVVIGTTNRDEGAYLGYVGKASDGMVDIQLISDVHKSEIYQTAKWLGIPQKIINASPSGDMYDGRNDTEVFGAPYDFVELYLGMLSLNQKTRDVLKKEWNSSDHEQYQKLGARLEKLHAYNQHKYKVGSPSIHLDLLPTAVPGGWQFGPQEKQWPDLQEAGHIVGLFSFSKTTVELINHPHAKQAILAYDCKAGVADEKVTIIKNLLTPKEIQQLLQECDQQKWVSVGLNGIHQDYDPDRDEIGSWRLTTYSKGFSKLLWERLASRIPRILTFAAGESFDAEGAHVWRAVGINPLFRVIKYNSKGKLVAHYDAPYDDGKGCRSLQSLILYLTNGQGATRFIKDPQIHLSPLERDYSDWDRPAKEKEVVKQFSPAAGTGIIFNHRVLHDSEPLKDKASPKIIIRTDIMYEKIVTP